MGCTMIRGRDHYYSLIKGKLQYYYYLNLFYFLLIKKLKRYYDWGVVFEWVL